MNAEIEPRCRIEGLKAANPLNSALLAFSSSMSPVVDSFLVIAGRSWPGTGEHEQVIGEHPQPHPPLHPAGASVATPPQSVTTFQCADASFAACAPAQSCARARLPRLARQDDVPDTAILRRALIAPGSAGAVSDGQVRGVIEQRDVPIQARRPERACRLAARADLVVSDELRLGLLVLHEPAELGRLGQLALSDDLGVRLEETDHLARKARIATENPGAGLRDHKPEQIDGGPQLRRRLGPAGQASFRS